MKKIYMCIISLMGFTMQAQQHLQGINFGDMAKPVPSISSLSTYTDTPPSLATGIPDISIPLVGITGYGGTNQNLQLSYSPLNVSVEEAAGEVGMGWTMFRGGVISRQINGIVDEALQTGYEEKAFDDEYYYNLPGMAGKFKTERNAGDNSIKIIDLTPLNHVKIEFTKQNGNEGLVFDSFTIKDDGGNTYYFNDFSIGTMYDRPEFYEMRYKSAFFLTRITDSAGIETAGFTYRKDEKSDGTTFLYQTCKLQSINTASGNIQIVYDYDQALEKTMNDPYSIKKILLNNSYAKVSEYAFEYSYPMVTYTQGTEKRRQLEKVKRMDGDHVLEQTSFVYNPIVPVPSSGLYGCAPSSEHHPSGILKKIINPSKGVSEYSYELSDTFLDRSSPSYIENMLAGLDPCVNYRQEHPVFRFHTGQTRIYNFTVSGDPSLKKTFWLDFIVLHDIVQNGPIDPHTGLPKPLTPAQMISYTLKKGNEILAIVKNEGTNVFYNYPGQYTIEATVPYVDGDLDFQLAELMPKPGPYRNALQNSDYRIRSVKRYNDISSTIPETSVLYSYDKFSTPNSSSGYGVLEGPTQFENVQVTNGSGNGYTRYYFKTQKDYPPYSIEKNGYTAYFQPYYNLLKSGILEKKEIYNESNQLLAKENYEYTFSIADDTDYLASGGRYSKTAFISQTKSTASVYPSGTASSVLQTVSESSVRADNYKTSTSKSTAADGTVTESLYQYAQDKNLTHLLTSNITGVPVETEVKKNGKIMGRSETRFDNTTLKYPTSSAEKNPKDGSTKTSVKYDLYDDKGNLIQYTSDIDPLTGKGNSVTVIWGYQKMMPIAKITGAKWSDIGTLADGIVAKSNADINAATEKELLTALDAFRNNTAFEKFQIITYSYDPLIGVTTVTPPTGMTEFYTYDTAGRLQSVKDANGHIIKEVKYNNKP